MSNPFVTDEKSDPLFDFEIACKNGRLMAQSGPGLSSEEADYLQQYIKQVNHYKYRDRRILLLEPLSAAPAPGGRPAKSFLPAEAALSGHKSASRGHLWSHQQMSVRLSALQCRLSYE